MEHIEGLAKPTPWCYDGSGLQREDVAQYYKIDEQLVLLGMLARLISANNDNRGRYVAALAEWRTDGHCNPVRLTVRHLYYFVAGSGTVFRFVSRQAFVME